MSSTRKPIYLDYAATTPIDPRVLDKMMPYLTDRYGNAHSRDHRFGWDAAEAVEEARYHVANLINATTAEIVLTSCATESINLAIKGVVARAAGERRHIVTSVVEHEAVLQTCRQLESNNEITADYIGVDHRGNVDLDELRRAVTRRGTLIVSLMHANNEIGTIYPIREAAEIAHQAGALFFTDATQSAGKIPIDVRTDGIDMLAFSAHKLYGPKGAGALFIRRGDPPLGLTPLLSGGGQERGLRSGTLNVPAIVGFGEACRIVETVADEATRLRQLRDRLESMLLSSLPTVTVNGDSQQRLPSISNLCFHLANVDELNRRLEGVAVGRRSACSGSLAAPSHVLRALRLADDDAYSSIRFSLGRFTTSEEIEMAAKLIAQSRQTSE